MNLVDLVAGAIIPVVVLLAVGFMLQRRFLPHRGLWDGLEKLSYFVFTPALFTSSLSAADLSTLPIGPVIITLVVPIVLMTGMIIALRRPLRAHAPDLPSLIQGGIRMNTYMGLIVASALAGSAGVAAFALTCAVVVPTVNVIAVMAHSAWGARREGAKRPSVFMSIVKNPLVLGCVVGIVLNLLPFDLPRLISEPIRLIAQPAMVIGTLVSGAALHFALDRKDVLHLSVATVLKLVVLPTGTVLLARLLGVEGVALMAVLLISALPTAPSAYVLATIMGGNARLMANITGVQTVVSLATLPLLLTTLL